jgi:LPS O-antigen subunit length determinant protein (WzzB/FepE family)
MNPSDYPAPATNSEVDLLQVLVALWKYKFFILSVAVLGALIGVIVALTSEPIFRAEVVVTEAGESGVGNSSSLVNQLSGLASLAGVRIGSGNNTEKQAHATLESRYLAEKFVEQHALREKLASDAKRTPSLWQAVNTFKSDVLSIRDDPRKSRTTVGIEWSDPKTAADWANEYVGLANELVRKRALDEATRNINFLNSQITKTNVVELQRTMYSLIESEMKSLMLASARSDYAFVVVDPAVAPELRVRPHRTVIASLGLLGGLILGGLLALLHSTSRSWMQDRRRLAT